MKNIFKILLFLALALLLVGLAMLNADRRVGVSYWPGASVRDVPVFLIILGSMFAGVVVAGVVSLLDQVKVRLRVRELERVIRDLRSELRELRNLPIDAG